MFFICSPISSSYLQTDFFLKNPSLLDKKEKVNIISFEFEVSEQNLVLSCKMFEPVQSDK